MFSQNFKKSAEEFFKLGPRGSKKNQNIMLVVGACGVLFGFFQLKYALNMKVRNIYHLLFVFYRCMVRSLRCYATHAPQHRCHQIYFLFLQRDLEKKNDHKHLADGTYVETA